MEDDMSGPYYLPPHVSFCICDGHRVIIDISGDRYVRLSGRQTGWFDELAAGTAAGPCSETALTFADRLVERGLLITQAGLGRPLQPHAAEAPRTDLVAHPLFNPPAPDARYATAAAFAIASAARLFGPRELADVLAAVSRRKARTSDERDIEKQIHLTSKFQGLVPFFMRSRDACKLHSAALVRFLSLFGEKSDWVFGVRLNPFGAHCWVQSGGTLLNDCLDRVHEHRAILTV